MYYWTIKIMKPLNAAVTNLWMSLAPANETKGHLKVNTGTMETLIKKILWSFTTHIAYWSVVIYVIVSLQIKNNCPLKW